MMYLYIYILIIHILVLLLNQTTQLGIIDMALYIEIAVDSFIYSDGVSCDNVFMINLTIYTYLSYIFLFYY